MVNSIVRSICRDIDGRRFLLQCKDRHGYKIGDSPDVASLSSEDVNCFLICLLDGVVTSKRENNFDHSFLVSLGNVFESVLEWVVWVNGVLYWYLVY